MLLMVNEKLVGACQVSCNGLVCGFGLKPGNKPANQEPIIDCSETEDLRDDSETEGRQLKNKDPSGSKPLKSTKTMAKP